MFYSHEILTSRKHGVATIWLVATLGPKSALKKVNRKAILEVNVSKVCETIVAPEAPLALRLQGNLLYGVSRVYLQQCGYMLADVQHAQNSIMAFRKLMRTTDLDSRAARTRPEQLMLPDDPAFLPELALPDFNLSLLLSDVHSGLAARSTIPRGLATARTVPSDQSVPQLIIPTSEGDGRGMLPFGAAETSSDLVDSETLYQAPFQNDDDEGLLADVDFEFDAEGNLRTVGRSDSAALATTEPRVRMEPDSAASARVRREHEEGLRAKQLREPVNDAEGSGMDVEYDLPEGLPFSPRPGAAEVQGVPSISCSHPEEAQALPPPTESTPAPRRRQPRAIELDQATELRRNEIIAWDNYYANNMAIASKAKQVHKLPSIAKQNAALWVFGAGVGNIGLGIGQGNLAGELHVFSGENLMQLVRPVEPPETPRKRKTPSDDEPAPDSEERRVRARQEEDEVGRGGDPMDVDDSSGSRGFDDDVEIGREAAAVLQDQSSAMPWNISASVRGSRPPSAIRPGPGLLSSGVPISMARRSSAAVPTPVIPSRRVSRITSSSPLVGRGRPSGTGDISGFDAGDTADEEALLGGLGLEEYELPVPVPVPGTPGAPAATVQRQALEPDTFNFLEYLRTNLEGRQQQQQAGIAAADSERVPEPAPARDYVVFEQVLEPTRHSKAVASQAFHHTLLLATKNIIVVEQAVAYGEIRISPMSRG